MALTGVTVVPIRELDTLADIVKWNARLSQFVTSGRTFKGAHHVLVVLHDCLGSRFGFGTFKGIIITSRRKRHGGALQPISGDLVFRGELRHPQLSTMYVRNAQDFGPLQVRGHQLD